jgi:3-oxoacyl-[acyl-carrier protein] reductase
LIAGGSFRSAVHRRIIGGMTTNSRVAIVTGASRGIGRAVAARLAADGFAIVVNYGRNHDEAAAAVAEVEEAGSRAIAVAADIAEEAEVAALFDKAEEAFGGVDVVVNCAGRMDVGPVAEFDLAVLDRMHRTNIRGTFVLAQQAVRRLRAGGAIITFSSSVVGLQFPNYAGYAMSKGAVEALSLILARELRGRDITVNTVAPGPTATSLLFDNNSEERLQQLASQPPLERLGYPADVAELVAFLASPQGHWVNGQRIRANGGII